MSKFLRIGLLTMLMLVLIAGTSFAGTLQSYKGDTFKVSSQALGSSKNVYMLGDHSNAPLHYSLGQNLVSGNLIKVDFEDGIVFPKDQTVYVCANEGGANQIGSATPSSSTNTVTIQAGTNTVSSFYVTTVQCSTGCYSTSSSNCAMNVVVTANQSGMKKATVSLYSQGIVYDGGSANFANIASEFNITYTTGQALMIDYVGAGANGKKFENNLTYGGAKNALISTYFAKDYGVASNSKRAAANAGAGNGLMMYFKDSQDYSGVSKIYVIRGADAKCDVSSSGSTVNNAITPPASGVASINATNAFSNKEDSKIAACFEVVGNVVLKPRTIKMAHKVTFGSAGVDMDSSDAFQDILRWDVNAYQGLITWIVKSDGFKTYCLLHNNSTQAGNVNLTTFSTEQGSSSTADLGSIGAGKSQLFVFGEQVAAGSQNYNLTGIQSGERYSAIMTVAVSQDQVALTCNQFDPGGAKRLVPVLTVKDGPMWKY